MSDLPRLDDSTDLRTEQCRDDARTAALRADVEARIATEAAVRVAKRAGLFVATA